MASTVVSTTLNFGLVSAPVAVKKCSAKKGTEIKSATPDDHPAGYVYADKKLIEEIAGQALANGAQPDPAKIGEAVLKVEFELGAKGSVVQKPRKGVFEGGDFHEIPVEAIEAIDEECKLPDLTIDGFIPLKDVPFERAIGAYFIAPQGKAGPAAVKPLVLLRDGLKLRGMAGFGRITFRSATYVFVIYERNGGLLLNTLEYAADFAQAHEAAEVLSGVVADEKTLQLAGALIDQLAVDVINLDGIENDRHAKREELVAQAIKGKKIKVTAKPTPEATAEFDLAAQLAASIGAAKPAPKSKKPVAA